MFEMNFDQPEARRDAPCVMSTCNEADSVPEKEIFQVACLEDI
jgi:hypothetical protein